MTRAACIAVALAIGLSALPTAAQAPAWQAPITLQGAGPFHRLSLPAAVYSRAGFDDLRDLRVRNASGQPVPYAWLDGDAEAAAPPVMSTRAPLFAVPVAPASASADAPLLGFRLRTDGSLALSVSATAKPAASATTEWVIDASKISGALVQARFELAPGALGLFAFTLDASDDLRHWRRIGADEQLVRLQQAGQTIERLALEIDHVHARFLRLRWRDPASAPALTGVSLDSVAEAEPVAALEWSGDVRPSTCAADHCDYAVPRGWPVQSLRITLTDANTLAPLQISTVLAATATARPPRNALYVLRHGRDRARGAAAQELLLADTVVYRLTQPGGEARSAPVPLDGATHTTLRLRSNGPIAALGSSPPSLSFGARPRTLVFLAQGTPPFTLSGNAPGQPLARDLPAPLPLATLVPGHRVGEPLAADAASITLPVLPMPIASAPTADATTSPDKRWLWAALGAGLLLLAAMAWSLLRGLKNAPTEPD
ncbi:MAG: DUF3999 domain-containing protein [Burkholderiales bacterium]